MTGLTEIQQAIEKLSQEERMELRRWFLTFGVDGVKESDEMMAAIDEGIRSLETHCGTPIEEVRQRFLDRWRTK